MINFEKLVVWTLDDQRYALPLSAVKRIVRLVEISSLPKAPSIILGVINVQGQIIPVVNVRKRFRLPEREVRLSDQLIIAFTSKQTVGVIVDTVVGVVEQTAGRIFAAEQIFPGLGYIAGVAKMDDGMVLIHDLGTFLSSEEEGTLDEAMKLPS
jgi:purine-binding chemotaxis protein CheW